MSTAHWILTWQVVLLGGLALFAGMSVWIAIEGWSDVKRMFSAMRVRPAARRRTRR